MQTSCTTKRTLNCLKSMLNLFRLLNQIMDVAKGLIICGYLLYKLNMHGNVRVGRQSLTKKISFHEKHPKPYRTIDSLQKAPTRKKINLNEYPLKKESHCILSGSSQKRPSRKINSLTKHEISRPLEGKKKSIMSSEPELATLQGLMNRNIKFSISREREKLLNKQKYKRSEQVRSVIEQKKMSSISKIQRKDTEPNPRISHIYSSITSEKSRQHTQKSSHFKDLNLESLINSAQGEQHEINLQDVFEVGCLAFYEYLALKEQKMTYTDNIKTVELKAIKQQLSAILDKGLKRFNTILQQAGEMSIKNIVMIGLVSYQQGRWNDTIMYLNKALDKTNDNLMLIVLPGPWIKANQTLTMLSSDAPDQHARKCNKLNLLAYLYLAESYKNTNNYLCGINTLLKWEQVFNKDVFKKPPHLNIKTYFQSIQPNPIEEDRPQQRMKKKSYVLQSNLQSDLTTNKFKKYSQAYHYSSIEFNKSNKYLKLGSDRNIREENEVERPEIKFQTVEHQADSVPILQEQNNDHEDSSEKEVTAIYLLLARLYVKIKSYDLAIRYYKKCLEYNPKKIEAILELASLFYNKGQAKKCLSWLNTALNLFKGVESPDEKLWLDIDYIKFHQSLILFQEGFMDQSYQLLQELKVKELCSEVSYYKGIIKLRKLSNNVTLKVSEKNTQLQSILMHFKQAIVSFTSREYLVKSYFQILLILVFEKKDYYGAQYEVNRFRKLVSLRQDTRQLKEDQENSFSRISRLFNGDEEESEETIYSSLGLNEGYFSMLFDIIDAVICILKMKIGKGLNMLKELSLRLQSQSHQVTKYYGCYQKQIVKLILQFKFYAYYIQRQYELSLKHINKLIESIRGEQPIYQKADPEAKMFYETDLRLLSINKLMLQCMILMKQGKFNYAISKLAEIQNTINQSSSQQGTNNALIVNNFYMVKSLCFINLYTQLEAEQQLTGNPIQESSEQTNKEILLSAEQLLRHCLISDKENSLIYYLISVIHYEVQEYESSLKYIRQALEYSDDHMIKHYFSKANTKAMLGRYDEAIKDYTNAVIVYKEQVKNENSPEKTMSPGKKIKKGASDDSDEYYQEKQIMFNEIYLNRAIAYIKQAYELSKSRKYTENINIILSYRLKATEDLCKYFQGLLTTNIDLNSQKALQKRLLLLMHADDPSHIFEISRKFEPRLKLLKEQDMIKGYYLIKELNNCISSLRTYLNKLQHTYEENQKNRIKKESLPSKQKKISMALPKTTSEQIDPQRIVKLHFDLTCLQALKKSSGNTQEALQESLISLLELTEEVYQNKESSLQNTSKTDKNTLQQLFVNNCGTIFKWSDILFFIGVIHFQLREYETAIKYFQESYNEKIMNKSLYSLEDYLYRVLTKSNAQEQEEQSIFSQLQPLFENRIYCKEELQYNMGICYLMLKKYKQAYFYLQNYPQFLAIIKKQITIDNVVSPQNQFMNEEDYKPIKKGQEMLIDDGKSSQSSQRHFKLNQESRENLRHRSQKSLNRNQQGYEQQSIQLAQKESSDCEFMNITPFPTKNRLCSIYPSSKIDENQFYLSFCLPKVQLPLLGLFYEDQIEPAKIYTRQTDKESNFSSQTSALRQSSEEKINNYKISQGTFESVIGHISLFDLQMKPIAPWIKQNTSGVIFTENLVNESVELNSSRTDRKKDRKENKEGTKKNRNQRYAEASGREQ